MAARRCCALAGLTGDVAVSGRSHLPAAPNQHQACPKRSSPLATGDVQLAALEYRQPWRGALAHLWVPRWAAVAMW